MIGKEHYEYIFNKCIKFLRYEKDGIYFKLYEKVIKLGGDGVHELFFEVISNFKKPSTIEMCINALSVTYSHKTLVKAIEFLVENKIIIKYEIEFQKISDEEMGKFFLENYFGACENENEASPEKIAIIKLCSSNLYNKRLIDFIPISNSMDILRPKKDNIIIFIFENNDLMAERYYKKLVEAKCKIIPIVVDNDEIIIGPFRDKDTDPCLACLRTSLKRNMTSEGEIFYDISSVISYEEENIQISINIAVAELKRINKGLYSPVRSGCICINALYFGIREHHIIKDYVCEVCQ